jgi:hypothetical protein
MHFSHVNVKLAIQEAKSRRKIINPYFEDFIDFLERLQRALRSGWVDLAIEEAAKYGYENSMATVFGKIPSHQAISSTLAASPKSFLATSSFSRGMVF